MDNNHALTFHKNEFDWELVPNADKFSVQQRIFVDRYMVHGNSAKAAREAGYSVGHSAIRGYQMLEIEHVRKEINRRLEAYAVGAEEVIRMISDIARNNIADYFIVKEHVEKNPVVVPLQHVIDRCRKTLESEREIARRVNLPEDKRMEHEAKLAQLEMKIIRLEVELEGNPDAYRIEDGPPKLVRHVELDLTRLLDDKDRGRIKSVKKGKYGFDVEMYDADQALYNLAKIHGLYKKDNEQQSKVPPMDKELNDKLLDLLSRNSK